MARSQMNDLTQSVAAAVVLYNPDADVYARIASYIDQVKRVYVIDNSVHYNRSLINELLKLEKIVYINCEGNKGIATALNRSACRAIDDGYELLLTMDQDTALNSDFVSRLSAELKQDKVGIVAPRYGEKSESPTIPFEDIQWTMTSGNILSLSAYKKAGPFQDELFIDHVDHEYCLRLRQNGFRIIQVNDVEIIHRPGNVMQINFFGIKKLFSTHSPQRLYYFCRNGFYVSKTYANSYPQFKKFFFKLLLKEICKIPLEKSRILRSKMLIHGFLDYKSNKFGPA